MKSEETNETKELNEMADQQDERGQASASSAETPATETGAAENEAAYRDTAEQQPAEQPTEQPTEQPAESEAGPESAEDPLVAELRKQAEDNHNRFLRAQADFDNYRRRTQKEKEELAQYASLKLVSQLLPVLDNFERALQTGGDAQGSDSFAKGVEMIYRQLMQVLEAEGLRRMEAVGAPFDPELHQAIMQVESEAHEEGTVVEVVQNGYWLKDKVIRPAMVKVSG